MMVRRNPPCWQIVFHTNRIQWGFKRQQMEMRPLLDVPTYCPLCLSTNSSLAFSFRSAMIFFHFNHELPQLKLMKY